MKKLSVLLFVLGVALGLSGCVSVAVPPPQVTAEVDESEISGHIEFLASPELEGRAPRSAGSRVAQRYIIEQFEQVGLKPWGDASSYTQKFLAGTNVIGVLRGSDPDLRDEFVVLSAHYDHIGLDHGELHLGAADNAAGVAVLLEVAEALAADRPGRSVVFAAFDCEERGLLGAYAFSGRDDFDPELFAGLVNLDMLGRDTFDVMPRTLVATGTGAYPRLRESVMIAAQESGLDLLPVGRELIGPRSDHVPLEPFGRPWVFLTCGPFADYHTPADTFEKIDVGGVVASALAAERVVRDLASAPSIESPQPHREGDRDELEAFFTVAQTFLAEHETLGLDQAEVEALVSLRNQIQAKRNDPFYGLEDRDGLMANVAFALMPQILNRDVSVSYRLWLLELNEFYVRYPQLYRDTRSEIAEAIIQHKTSLFASPRKESYRRAGFEPGDYVIQELGDDRWRVSAYFTEVNFTLRLREGRKGSASIGSNWQLLDITAGRDDIVDYLLMLWHGVELAGGVGDPWRTILTDFVGRTDLESYEGFRGWWFAEQGYKSNIDWWNTTLRNGQSKAQALAASHLLRGSDPKSWEAVGELIVDPAAHPEVRAATIRRLKPHHAEQALDWLRAIENDQTAISFRASEEMVYPVYDPTYPYYSRMACFTKRTSIQATDKERQAAQQDETSLLGVEHTPTLGLLSQWVQGEIQGEAVEYLIVPEEAEPSVQEGQ